MIISTTPSLEGKAIKKYMGVIFGEAISGIDFMRDWGASIANFTGGRVSEYEEEIVNARADAIEEMMDRAKKVGANAIVGVKVDTEAIGTNGAMLMVTVSGTAVVVE